MKNIFKFLLILSNIVIVENAFTASTDKVESALARVAAARRELKLAERELIAYLQSKPPKNFEAQERVPTANGWGQTQKDCEAGVSAESRAAIAGAKNKAMKDCYSFYRTCDVTSVVTYHISTGGGTSMGFYCNAIVTVTGI